MGKDKSSENTVLIHHLSFIVHRSASGYALLLVMMIVTLLLIALTVAVPDIFTQDRREREEELIFRGNQYARAVGMFHAKYNRYPSTVKEMLQTNGLRFLRKEFKDPMTKDGKWRFIHMSPAGVMIDSKNQGIPGA